MDYPSPYPVQLHGRRLVWYRPRLEVLEARLPPGDALLGVLVSGALLAPAFVDGGTELGTTDLGMGEELPTALVAVAQPERSAPADVTAGREQPAASTDDAMSRSAGELGDWPRAVGRWSGKGAVPVLGAREDGGGVLVAGAERLLTPMATLLSIPGELPAVQAVGHGVQPPGTEGSAGAQVPEGSGRLPLSFEQNQGQTDA